MHTFIQTCVHMYVLCTYNFKYLLLGIGKELGKIEPKLVLFKALQIHICLNHKLLAQIAAAKYII